MVVNVSIHVILRGTAADHSVSPSVATILPNNRLMSTIQNIQVLASGTSRVA
jgi:hypothetical protein